MSQTATLDLPLERKSGIRPRRIALAALAGFLLCAGATGWAVYTHRFESTDDAQIDGHINTVSPRISGSIAHVYVSDNQRVEAGQPLVDLDDSEQKVAYDQAKAQYDQALAQLQSQRPNIAITQANNTEAAAAGDAQLAQAHAALAAASQDLAGASARLAQAFAARTRDDDDFERYKQLFQAGTVSRQDYERVLATAKASDANATASQAAVASAEKVVEERNADVQAQAARRTQVARTAPRQLAIRQADLATAEANVEVAAAQLQRAALNLSFCHILSPVRGIVTQRSAEIGNRVSEAQPLMMVVETGDTWVNADFKETQLARMHAGQQARVHVDALNRDFTGSVVGSPAITGSRSSVLPPENATGNFVKVVQRLPLRIHLDAGQQDLDRLHPGMSVEATVWLR